jgi:peptidoglycan/xylan/chitin deacetylase (PgdA/CDA1 family)
MPPAVLLSYDVEEFDMPFEYGGNLPFTEQIDFSVKGLEQLLPLLNSFGAKATFYCTGRFAEARPDWIKILHTEGHEIASHTYHHSQFEDADLLKSKQILENIIGSQVHGLRMPRMRPVEAVAVKKAGYLYNSSLNPTWLPGRYKHLDKPRTAFSESGMLQLPASVSPSFRLPLFWLSFHNFPFSVYWQVCKKTIARDGYLNLYYHPWEFLNYRDAGGAKFPGYVVRNCGEPMLQRTEKLLQLARQNGYSFMTTYNWLQQSGTLLA